jgi:two-component system, chemotaxis family, protein-glutamate methylesterase/glutaminase
MAGVELVVVGTSWGGIDALGRLLADLREDFRPAIAAVLHRGIAGPEDALAPFMQSRSLLPVVEIEDKQPIEPGRVHIAPGDYHALVEPGHFALSLEAPVQYSRPSIDVLFETAAQAYGAAVVGVIMTGANRDGADGIKTIKSVGGRTFAQDPATAERAEMPQSAIDTGAVDEVLGIEEIASELNALGRKS